MTSIHDALKGFAVLPSYPAGTSVPKPSPSRIDQRINRVVQGKQFFISDVTLPPPVRRKLIHVKEKYDGLIKQFKALIATDSQPDFTETCLPKLTGILHQMLAVQQELTTFVSNAKPKIKGSKDLADFSQTISDSIKKIHTVNQVVAFDRAATTLDFNVEVGDQISFLEQGGADFSVLDYTRTLTKIHQAFELYHAATQFKGYEHTRAYLDERMASLCKEEHGLISDLMYQMTQRYPAVLKKQKADLVDAAKALEKATPQNHLEKYRQFTEAKQALEALQKEFDTSKQDLLKMKKKIDTMQSVIGSPQSRGLLNKLLFSDNSLAAQFEKLSNQFNEGLKFFTDASKELTTSVKTEQTVVDNSTVKRKAQERASERSESTKIRVATFFSLLLLGQVRADASVKIPFPEVSGTLKPSEFGSNFTNGVNFYPLEKSPAGTADDMLSHQVEQIVTETPQQQALTGWMDGFLQGTNTTSVEWTQHSPQEVLKCLKSIEYSNVRGRQAVSPQYSERTYRLREECLLRSDGGTNSCVAYTYSSDPEDCQAVDRVMSEEAWHPIRAAYQRSIVAEEFRKAIELSQAMKGKIPATYALRGNTASGKTRALNSDSFFKGILGDRQSLEGTINPDPIKSQLQTSVRLSSTQVHREGSVLSSRIQRAVVTQDPKASIIIDKRLNEVSDVEQVLTDARSRGVQANLLDIEAPLEDSCLGVLERPIGSTDPLVPFRAVAEGFKGIRDNRSHLINAVKKDFTVGHYKLYVRHEGRNVLVAEKSPSGGFAIIAGQEELYRGAISPASTASIESIGRIKITPDYLKEVYTKRPWMQGKDMERYIGYTMSEAMDAHNAGKI